MAIDGAGDEFNQHEPQHLALDTLCHLRHGGARVPVQPYPDRDGGHHPTVWKCAQHRQRHDALNQAPLVVGAARKNLEERWVETYRTLERWSRMPLLRNRAEGDLVLPGIRLIAEMKSSKTRMCSRR